MNFYPHHIGDYAQATMHLNLIEDAIYSRLLRRYYAEEEPIVDDIAQVCRWVGARSEEEREAVPRILHEFFELHDGHWHNKRADAEISAYQEKREKAASSARKRWEKQGKPDAPPPKTARNANAMRTHTEGNANQNQNQNQNQTDKTKGVGKPPPFRAKDIPLPPVINADAWSEWCSFRSSKRKPITRDAADKQVELLAQYPRHVQRQIIEHSIRNDYQGLFPPKGGGPPAHGGGPAAAPSSRNTSLEDDLQDTSWAH